MRLGLVQIERTRGTGARVIEEVEGDHGGLMAAAAATLRALLRSSLSRSARFHR